MQKENTIGRRQAIKKSGLYVGGVLSLSALTTLLQGCKVPLDPDWAPRFFTETESETLAYLAEAIIPKTDTPGALDAKVHRYLDVMADEVFPKEQSEKFQQGLTKFSSLCEEKFGSSFGDLSEEQKSEVIAEAAQESEGSFYDTMKRMTIAGFFTSEMGMKEVLKFDPIPGSYNGCMPLDEVGGTWAL